MAIEKSLEREDHQVKEEIPLRLVIRSLRSALPFTCNLNDIKSLVDDKTEYLFTKGGSDYSRRVEPVLSLNTSFSNVELLGANLARSRY